MVQSPEYPDLRWMPPRSWTNANRTSVQLIVIHTTEGSSHDQSAEDGAAYDWSRTDGTSAHYYVDSNSVVHCVRTADQAHTARTQGNRRGIQYELCGRAGWSASTWKGDYQQAMLKLAAKQAARDAKKWAIPVRHLTVAQVAGGSKGFCSHWDVTRAFPADGGTHTDPGPNFPWSQFLDLVRAELNPPPPEETPDMSFTEDTFTITDATADALNLARGTKTTGAGLLQTIGIRLAAIGKDVDAENAEIVPTAEQNAAAVVARLTSPATPDEQVAATLSQLLGSRKAAVIALMRD